MMKKWWAFAFVVLVISIVLSTRIWITEVAEVEEIAEVKEEVKAEEVAEVEEEVKSVPFSAGTRTLSDSGYKKESPTLVTVVGQDAYDGVTKLINDNPSQMLYDFVPCDDKYVYFFVFAGKTNFFDEVDIEIKGVSITNSPGEIVEIKVTCSIKHSVSTRKGERTSPWQSAKVLLKNILSPEKKSRRFYRFVLDFDSIVKDAISVAELVRHDQLIIAFNDSGISQEKMTELKKRFDAKVVEYLIPPNPKPDDKLVRVLLEVGNNYSVEETMNECKKLPEVKIIETNHFHR